MKLKILMIRFLIVLSSTVYTIHHFLYKRCLKLGELHGKIYKKACEIEREIDGTDHT